ncbi:MAG: tRNA lysidine(34) synthetase TilS [Proteobacteria bacterium]|nr:tRNA lysidine(34) synthetase TilS [Pseudomonadota bacterium]MBU1389993.1 tRNA lysidine(34) synthetase TilS [Pseudomonadota bacterium]MBU1545056.1 tRNA lysidine(34) synthetase TilS [Pseudomonadota bacterium]MBU2480435.1 tRNA lysidine(34) synthetase TilS [Pseudomonadota bacterium]
MTDERHIVKNFIRIIQATLCEFNMLARNDAVLAAVSGGPDSVALIRALMAFREEYGLRLGVVHLNHQLRKDAALRDQEFVRKLAATLDLPFYTEQMDVKTYARTNRLSIETAGRKLRYQFFEKTAQNEGYCKIATGHHKDDNAEQVLMNLLRGSGPKGLSGIPPVRGDTFIRPLIRVSKLQIRQFLEACEQPFVTDESNTDLHYLRNKIRHQLIPHLQEEYNPEIVDALDRLSHILRQEETLWKKQTIQQLNQCVIKKTSQQLILSKPQMKKMDQAILQRVFRMAIKQIKSDLNRISHTHINDCIQFCFNPSAGSSLDLPGRIRVYKTQDTIEIKKEDAPLREIGKLKKQQRQAEQ